MAHQQVSPGDDDRQQSSEGPQHEGGQEVSQPDRHLADMVNGRGPILVWMIVIRVGQVLESIEDWLQLVDNNLRSGEKEGNDEDEQIGNDLLDCGPASVGHILPDDITRGRSIPDSPFVRSHGILGLLTSSLEIEDGVLVVSQDVSCVVDVFKCDEGHPKVFFPCLNLFLLNHPLQLELLLSEELQTRDFVDKKVTYTSLFVLPSV